MIARILAGLKGVLRRQHIASEVDEELSFHIAQETEANIARGMSPIEARRVVLRDLGVTQTRESVRDLRRFRFEAVWQDFRQAAYRLLREPAFTLVATLTLALAVGVNTAILGVADAVLFRPLPYKDPDRVFVIQMMSRETGSLFSLVPYRFVDAINRMNGDLGVVGMSDSGPRISETTEYGPRLISTAA